MLSFFSCLFCLCEKCVVINEIVDGKMQQPQQKKDKQGGDYEYDNVKASSCHRRLFLCIAKVLSLSLSFALTNTHTHPFLSWVLTDICLFFYTLPQLCLHLLAHISHCGFCPDDTPFSFVPPSTLSFNFSESLWLWLRLVFCFAQSCSHHLQLQKPSLFFCFLLLSASFSWCVLFLLRYL